MAGTILGGKKAAKTNKKLYGENWYKKIGSVGGRVKCKKGFATNPALAREAGRLGGTISRRGKGGGKRNVKGVK